MKKHTLLFSAVIFLGVCYLWPWAVRQKVNHLKNGVPKTSQPKSVEVKTPGKAGERTVNQQPIQLIFPVKGKGLAHIISYFGDPREGGKRKHEGVDIAATRGTAVLAVADGKVEKVKEGGSGGKQIWLELNNGWKVYYAHLHTQLVEEGQVVESGDRIGTVGNTGNAINAGPHLHFSLYPSERKPLNPLLYLPGQLSIH